MAVTSSFYNDNLYRAYPLIANQPEAIPARYLAGIKVYCSYSTPFRSFPSVYLTGLVFNPEGLVFTFECTDGITAITKRMTVSSVPVFTRVFSEDTGDDINITLITGTPPKENEQIGFSNIRLQIEPVCIFWLRHRGISEIRIGNQARYKLDADSEGLPLEYLPDAEWWNQPADSVLVLRDQPLLFSEGWNCNLTLSCTDQKVGFNAREQAGSGEVSEDVPRGYIVGRIIEEEIPAGEEEEPEVRKEIVPDPDNGEILTETVPAPFLRFDGLPDNRLIAYSVCGAVGPDITVQASDTVLVRADQDVFTIFVGVANLGGGSC
jgi:hypothetical protein